MIKDTAQIVSGFIHLRLTLLQQRDRVFYLGVVLLQTLLQEGLGQEQFPKAIWKTGQGSEWLREDSSPLNMADVKTGTRPCTHPTTPNLAFEWLGSEKIKT